jgi:hypothetical protein
MSLFDPSLLERLVVLCSVLLRLLIGLSSYSGSIAFAKHIHTGLLILSDLTQATKRHQSMVISRRSDTGWS